MKRRPVGRTHTTRWRVKPFSKDELARRIKTLREQRGWNQLDLAKAIGKSQQHVSRMENPNRFQVTLSTLSAVAEALGCSLVVELHYKPLGDVNGTAAPKMSEVKQR